MASQQQVTQLLPAWSRGDQSAPGKLMPLVYGEMQRLARRYMAHERADHTLQVTALVNEAYLRLVDARQVPWQNHAHFFAFSARVMRRLLVDLARSRHYLKREGAAKKVPLEDALAIAQEGPGLGGAR